MSSRKSNVSHEMAAERVSGMQEKLQELKKEEPAATEQKPSKLTGDVRDLIFSGRKTIDVEASGFKFSLQTLKSKENQIIVKEILLLPNEERVMTARNYTISFALKSINDVSLEDYYQGDDISDVIDKRLAIIDELDENLVEFLFTKYVELKNDLIKSFNVTDISDAIKK